MDAKSVYTGLVEFLSVDSQKAVKNCLETSMNTALELVKGV